MERRTRLGGASRLDSCNPVRIQNVSDRLKVGVFDLNQGAQFLCEKRWERVRSNLEVESGFSCERHFGGTRQKTAVGAVMVREQQVSSGQRLNRVPEITEIRRIIHIWRLRTGLGKHLGKD